MFPLSHMLKSFVRTGTLTVIDAEGKRHTFGGTPGPKVTMRLTDPKLYKSLFFNPELRLARERAKLAQATAENAGLWEDPTLSIDALRVVAEALTQPRHHRARMSRARRQQLCRP